MRTLTALCLTGLLCGCGGGGDLPPLGTVSGTVTLDGQPVEGAMVQFTPATTRASLGFTNKDGHYTLMFNDSAAGAAVGQHVVRISKRADPAKNPELGNRETIPIHFNEKSTLTKEVKAGKNEAMNFTLTSGGAAVGAAGSNMPGASMPGAPGSSMPMLR